MWECRNCKEEIEDRYAHCWNCGKPKTEGHQEFSAVRIHLKDEPPREKRSRIENESHQKEKLPPENETAPQNALPPREKIPFEEKFLFENEYSPVEKSSSVIGKIAPLFLWLAAAVALSYFAYYSNQKTKAFENRIAEEFRNLNGQTSRFVFAKNAPREKNAAVKAKVLPLNAQNNQIDPLYGVLPDDLRPSNLEEVRTILWLDCNPKEVWRYEDGSPGYRESCNAYLADKETSKIIQIEEFPGAMPPLRKRAETGRDTGKVMPEVYISYINANQPPAERTPAGATASDSPEHHFWFKSELLYALILLGLLGAIGVGWIVYKIKSVVRKTE